MITIPEPCNEDFNRMTPTQRGAFCDKCQIDTFDFRNTSTKDINKIILENKGAHLCGQFKNEQLEELNQGYKNWKNQKTKTFRSKFVLALFFAFGLSLFSCNEEDRVAIEDIQAIEIVENVDVKTRFINEDFQNPNFDLLDYVTEEIQRVEVEEFVPNCLEAMEEPLEILEEEITVVTKGMVDVDRTMLGGFGGTLEYYEYLEDTMVEVEVILPELTPVEIFEAKAYPNPTHNISNLALDIEMEGRFDIRLFDINGKQVQTIYAGDLSEGRQTFEVSLEDLTTGMYFVKVISGGQNETVKIQKI